MQFYKKNANYLIFLRKYLHIILNIHENKLAKNYTLNFIISC